LLVGGLVNAVFATLYTTLVARIYAQIAPAPASGT
jgi:hypothetical protein